MQRSRTTRMSNGTPAASEASQGDDKDSRGEAPDRMHEAQCVELLYRMRLLSDQLDQVLDHSSPPQGWREDVLGMLACHNRHFLTLLLLSAAPEVQRGYERRISDDV